MSAKIEKENGDVIQEYIALKVTSDIDTRNLKGKSIRPLSKERIEKFQELYRKRLNEELTFKEAQKRAEKVRRLIHLTYRPPP